MLDNPADEIIQTFFNALTVRNFARCTACLDELGTLVTVQPAVQDWIVYLTGILLNERDHNWAGAVQIFSGLLERPLDPALRARTLMALGVSLFLQGRWCDSISTYEQSLVLFTELNQPVDQAKIWKNMAHCQYAGYLRGEFGPDALDAALEHCRQALDVLADRPNEAWLIGTVWNAMGLVYGCLEQWDAALDGFQRHIEACQNLPETDWYGIGVSYLNIGEIHHRRGPESWPQAMQAYQKALELIHSDPPAYDEMDVLANLGYLCQETGDVEQALNYYQRAIACIEILRSSNTSADVRANFLAATVDTYAHTILLYARLGEAAAAFAYAEQARARAFLEILESRSAELVQQLSSPTLTATEVQTALPPDTLLLAYFSTGLLEAHDHLPVSMRRHRFPPAHILLFALTRDTIRVHDLGLSPTVLQPSDLNNVVERHFLDPAIRRTLYDRLIAPVADLLPQQRRIYLAPHGPLHYIPFQALIAPDGETLLREDGPQIVYAPSATILLRPVARPGAAPTEDCLALAYNGDEANRLNFGEDEARSIVRMMSGAVMDGSQLKKERLYALAQHYRCLHFSCHGIFDAETPLASSLSLAPGEHLTALDVIENLRLNCDLVCLSACESGLSRVRRGDELEGLTRAFFFAGTSVLVCSLWRVDERSTRILMERFYQEVRRGTSFAEALKRAQLYLRSLTRRQVHKRLIHYRASDLLHDASPAGIKSADPALMSHIEGQASPHVKGIGPTGSKDTAVITPENDNDLIFAAPFYWAPFIVIGEPVAQPG